MTYLPHQKLLLRFSLRKKINKYFVLRNSCKLKYNGSLEKQSNSVMVISPINKRYEDNDSCSTPFWRL